MEVLRLRARCDRRLRAGHLWVYSNEVDVAHSSLKQYAPGQSVVLEDHQGKPLGMGYVNPNTLICARLLSRDYRQAADIGMISKHLRAALELRQALFPQPYYRLVYGESDRLPGLVVDRYGDVLVAQFNTAGMECLREIVLDALMDLLQPCAIVLRNDTPARELEGLPYEIVTALGELPEAVLIEENETRFAVSVMDGQKTGWFYDHRLNRLAMQHMVRGKQVLDVFSYTGGWGVQAAWAGAAEVTMLDSSLPALQLAQENAQRNGCADRCHFIEGKAQQALKGLVDERRLFDLVVLDPPAFIKRRKDITQGEIGYRRVNEQAMKLLRPGGFLISASCSMHLEMERLKAIVAASARQTRREMRIIGQGYQGPDHPLHPAIPETAYLKAVFCQV